jgi:hypothetical protein
MQLQPDLWIEGPFYVDFNAHGELRVVGPGNHIYLGLPGIGKESFSVQDVKIVGGQLRLVLGFNENNTVLNDPVIRDVRFVRRLTEGQLGVSPSFAQLLAHDYSRVGPETAEITDGEEPELVWLHRFGEDWYGCRVKLLSKSTMGRDDSGMATRIKGSEPVLLEITTDSNFAPTRQGKAEYYSIDLGTFRDRADFIRHIFTRTTAEISHLIGSSKTSGYSHGTVFPRDWMESATLGVGDFTPAVIDLMYHRSLAHVDEQGRGWHEDLVGEALHRVSDTQLIDPLSGEIKAERVVIDEISRPTPKREDHPIGREDHPVDREMTDIEPRYLIGMELLSPEFWKNQGDVERLRRVAGFVLTQARTQNFIVLREEQWGRRDAGAWRDSKYAYSMLGQPIADFAVNAVFYPAALRAIKKFRLKLKMAPREVKDVDSLIQKWDDIRNLYSYRTRDGHSCFALALGGAQRRGGQLIFTRFEVTHTDEAYYLLYLEPTREEVMSFVGRLLDPNYFYTPSGPLVIGAQQPEYTTRLYHGKVIWTKQTALISAAIMRQIERARKEKWPKEQLQQLEQVVSALFNSALSSFASLGEIPELHIDDVGQPRFFDDQIDVEVAANRVQLWSAVGARRIIRDYYQLIRNA